MKGEVDRKVIYGSGKFIDKVNKECNIEAVIRHKGRLEKEKKEKKSKNKTVPFSLGVLENCTLSY